MSFDTVDVLVIGAGPAGCSSAIAVQGNVDSVLLCAVSQSAREGTVARVETLNRSGMHAAEILGLRGCFDAAYLGEVGQFVRDGAIAQLGAASDESLEEHRHIERGLLDSKLLSEVRRRNIPITQSRICKVVTNFESIACTFADGRTVMCRLLIDATGRSRSTVPCQRKLLSPPLRVSTGRIAADEPTVEPSVTQFSSFWWGWLWLAGECGEDLPWTALTRADLEQPSEISMLLERSRQKSVAHYCATWQVNLQRHPRILPVGDASGSLDPASGAGITHALATSISAVDVAQALRFGGAATDKAAAHYHEMRIGLILAQADELSQRYQNTGIFQE